jgi:hypothetical protein
LASDAAEIEKYGARQMSVGLPEVSLISISP